MITPLTAAGTRQVQIVVGPSPRTEASASVGVGLAPVRRRPLVVLRRHWQRIVGTALLATLIALSFARFQAPIYRATAILLVDSTLAGASDSPYSPFWALLADEQRTRTIQRLLTVHPVMVAAVRSLGLEVDPKQLAQSVDVERVPETRVIRLSASSTDPETAAALANAIPVAFSEYTHTHRTLALSAERENLLEADRLLSARIDAAEVELTTLAHSSNSKDSAGDRRLLESLAQDRSFHRAISQRLFDLNLAASQPSERLEVIEPARAPRSPIRPRLTLYSAGGFLIGLLVSSATVIVADHLDDTLESPDEAATHLQLPVLGVLPWLAKEIADREPIVRAAHSSEASEAYRFVSVHLQMAAIGRPLRRVLVTSAEPGEGKSTLVRNLGILLTQAGRTVAIVDADLRRPSQHRQLGLPNRLGLSTAILAEKRSLEGSLRPTPYPGLIFLGTGPLPPNPAEVLGSGRMARLLDELSERVDITLIDCCPVTAAIDPVVLAARVDAVILTLALKETQLHAALRAKEELARAGAGFIGLVITHAPSGRSLRG